MNIPSIYKRLAENPKVADVLGWPFDFEIRKPYLLSDDWPILLSSAMAMLMRVRLNNSKHADFTKPVFEALYIKAKLNGKTSV